MAVLTDPARAYRRVQRDAAILGSDQRALILLCYDEFLAAISSALHADRYGSPGLLREALGHAASALSAIRAGTDPAHPIAVVLESMFDAAHRAIRGAMVNFRSVSLQSLYDDFNDIRRALAAAPDAHQ